MYEGTARSVRDVQYAPGASILIRPPLWGLLWYGHAVLYMALLYISYEPPYTLPHVYTPLRPPYTP